MGHKLDKTFFFLKVNFIICVAKKTFSYLLIFFPLNNFNIHVQKFFSLLV